LPWRFVQTRIDHVDEPTTALDVAQSQVLDFDPELPTQVKVGPMLITHDIGVIAQIADKIQRDW
jgi:ABC-type dipeptide/oligopeptide/nickel transport system ATPase component